MVPFSRNFVSIIHSNHFAMNRLESPAYHAISVFYVVYDAIGRHMRLLSQVGLLNSRSFHLDSQKNYSTESD